MNEIKITIPDKDPMHPKADFAFYIDYNREIGSASRIFDATSDFIKACEKFDKELLQSIDTHIETVMCLEDVEVGSIKTWLKSALTSTDDQAIKELNWQKFVGSYLVKGKYLVLQWADNENKLDADNAPKELASLGEDIKKLASETNVKHLPDYTAPSQQALVNFMKDSQGVKNYFVEGDVVEIITPDQTHKFNLNKRHNFDAFEEVLVKESVINPPILMILTVKKPDYLGESRWELLHGKRSIKAKIENTKWLEKFQNREVNVRPGDALKCHVKVETSYGYSNELISEKYSIMEITEIIEASGNKSNQSEMFRDNDT